MRSQYTIEPLTLKDTSETLDFLRKYFFKDEPMNKYLDLGECVDVEKFSVKDIKDNCSFKAVNNEGRIIGVFLNALEKRSSNAPSLAETCEHKKFKLILELFDYIETQFDIFDLYPNADTILDGKIVSVDPNYRRMGIAQCLVEKGLNFMRENSIPAYKVVCTSHFSASLLEKMHFRDVYKLLYKDYKVDGKVILKPAEPHLAVRILVRELPEPSSRL